MWRSLFLVLVNRTIFPQFSGCADPSGFRSIGKWRDFLAGLNFEEKLPDRVNSKFDLGKFPSACTRPAYSRIQKGTSLRQ